jgi:hypothetical protein
MSDQGNPEDGTENQLFEPDANYASGWHVDDPLAQGGLKHAAIVVLDELEEALEELESHDPHLGEIGPLGLFPESVRAAMTPWLASKIHAAALIMGWKLAQPGTAIPPGCIAEELALELIRQQADDSLDLTGADPASIDATKGVYRVCFHGDLMAYFDRQSPSDIALAANYSILAAEDSNVQLSKWFRPFFPGQIGAAVHPWFYESPWGPLKRSRPSSLEPVEPSSAPELPKRSRESFRVLIRTWDDDFLDEEFSRMPAQWLLYLQAPNANAAREEALRRLQEVDPGRRGFRLDSGEESLDRPDISRTTIDVQRVGLTQEFKDGLSFHIVGSFEDGVPGEDLAALAGHLAAHFPRAIVATEGDDSYFAVTVNAESFEEAEADFEDALEPFMEKVGFEDFPINSSSTGPGGRSLGDLWRDLLDYEWRSENRA